MGFPGHLANTYGQFYAFMHAFQSQTGNPGHLALRLTEADTPITTSPFQSRAGFPGHLAGAIGHVTGSEWTVSIPNGLRRPFSLHEVPKQRNVWM